MADACLWSSGDGAWWGVEGSCDGLQSVGPTKILVILIVAIVPWMCTYVKAH